MKLLAAAALLVSVLGCSPQLTEAETTWCENHYLDMTLAADQLGLLEQWAHAVTKAAADRVSHTPRDVILRSFYSDSAVISACRLAFEAYRDGRPFVSQQPLPGDPAT